MNFQLNQQELFKPIKRSPPMLAVAITPNGDCALSSGLDFVLRMWDLGSGECTQTWEAGGPLSAIAGSPNREWILLSTVMGALQWDLEQWQFMRSFMTFKGGTEDLVYADKLGMVIGAGEDSLIYRWDIETGEKQNPLADHMYPVSALAVIEKDNLLLSGDSSGELRLWGLSSGDCLGAWQAHDSKITDLAILSRSGKLISVSQEMQIRTWDLDTGKPLQEMSGHTGWINALAVSEEENWMLTGGEDGIRIWDLGTYQNVYSDASMDIACLALSPDEQLAISGGRDGSLSIWSLQ